MADAAIVYAIAPGTPVGRLRILEQQLVVKREALVAASTSDVRPPAYDRLCAAIAAVRDEIAARLESPDA